MLDLRINPDLPVRRLSVAQMQLVEIARALSLQSRILLLDEPTASITGNEIAVLFKLLNRLKEEGVAILFVSHKLEEGLRPLHPGDDPARRANCLPWPPH